MSGPDATESLCKRIAMEAFGAKGALRMMSGAQRTELLHAMARGLRSASTAIVQANQRDLEAGAGLGSAMLDRLRLDATRIEAMARAVDAIALQPDPVGVVEDGRTLPNGIRLEKRRTPIGVVLVIYESRPNVTSDAAALCLKAGNAVVLRGGKEAAHSNRAIIDAMRPALAKAGVEGAVGFVDTPDRRAIDLLVTMEKVIDLAIPRGGPSLMQAVTAAARIPVVKHDAGNCHVYIDRALDGLDEQALAIVVNAKAQRPGVCNAAETLLVHESQAARLLPRIGKALQEAGVEVRADARARPLMPGATEASEADWATEYLDLILAVRVVDSLDEACAHIRTYGSQHTEAIVTSSIEAAERFVALLDSANVMINCSTRFADGAEYGLGAEIGISTDKLHARGPMGAQDLTTYQWVLTGSGQIRG